MANQILTIPLVFLLAASLSCQPETRRDRAGVGAAADSTPAPVTTEAPEGRQGTTEWTLNSSDWNGSLKLMCERGQLSACSQLAYEAQRDGKAQEAVAYFTKACLADAELTDCVSATTANARSCFEVAKLYEAQGRGTDAGQFKVCSCARKFKPAC